jgi:hypothetical protein
MDVTTGTAQATLRRLSRSRFVSVVVWSACLPWQPWRYLPMRICDHDLGELIDLPALGPWKVLRNDDRDLAPRSSEIGAVRGTDAIVTVH